MRIRAAHLVEVVLGLALAAPAAPAAPLAVGQKLAPFGLPRAGGGELDLATLQGRKAYVLAFVALRCPVSNAYDARLAAFAEEYTPKGVALVGIDSAIAEAPADIAEHARTSGLPFPILRDEGNVRADELGAQFAPEVFVFDAEWTLRYRGRIDDDPSGSAVPSADLTMAVDAVLAGREVRLKQTKAFGCAIRRLTGQEATR
jgi:peroxiredoxin